uniref:TLC domain-containing protein n=2 Tax=Aplanochytrium stocchinoi TaxID=215587 RepID=A0A6S8CKA0_9STRA|mmetsp:Transcript_14643/g.18945  ORF Transcript_14643/g.18945 Transcript_14643/m.18945 type:complete len:271 (+) Transcript_14643:21-833(+)
MEKHVALDVVGELFAIPRESMYNTFMSFLFFGVVEFLSSILYPLMIPTYWKSFEANQRLKLIIITVSSAHCVVLFYFCYFLYFEQDDFLAKDVFFANTEYSRYTHSLSAGYFIWDTIIVCRTVPFDAKFLLHGVVCGFNYWIAQRPTLHFYGYRFLLFELSTPILNLRYLIMLFFGENARLVAPLGIAFGISFLCVRILWGIPLMVGFIQNILNKISTLTYEEGIDDIVNTIIWCIFGVSACLMSILNLYWLFAMISGKTAQEERKQKQL